MTAKISVTSRSNIGSLRFLDKIFVNLEKAFDLFPLCSAVHSNTCIRSCRYGLQKSSIATSGPKLLKLANSFLSIVDKLTQPSVALSEMICKHTASGEEIHLFEAENIERSHRWSSTLATSAACFKHRNAPVYLLVSCTH